MKETPAYKEGYSSLASDECPYNFDRTGVEGVAAVRWYKGRIQAQEDRANEKLRAEYSNQQELLHIGQSLDNCPLIISRTVTYTAEFNPKYDSERFCVCNHPYHRHFDWMEEDRYVGCKYVTDCHCTGFKEKIYV